MPRLRVAVRQYVEDTTLHGIKDTVYAKTKLARVLWILAMVSGLVALGIQIWSVIAEYARDDFGTRQKAYFPKEMPSIMVCPDNPQFKNASEEVKNYIMGFFVFRFADGVPSMDPTAYQTAKATFDQWLAESDGDFHAVLKNKFDVNFIIWEYQYPAEGVRMKREVVLTSYGPCVVFSTLAVITPQLSPLVYFHYKFRVDHEDPLGAVPMYPQAVPTEPIQRYKSYQVAVGEKSTFGVNPPESSFLIIENRVHARVAVSVIDHHMYPGRNKKRCTRAGDQSDEMYSGLQELNNHCDPCKIYVPPSTSFRMTATADNYCNVYNGGGIPACAIKFLLDPEFQKLVAKTPQVPCQGRKYQFTEQTSAGNESTAGIQVMLASPPSGVLVEEYPTMHWGGLLAALGGSIGLFFGASVMSLIQCGVPILEYLCTGKKAKTHQLGV